MFLFDEASYYTNIKELTIIETNFNIIREKVLDNVLYNPYNSKESIAIEQAVKSLFNFDKVYINWSIHTHEINATTNPITFIIPLSKEDISLVKDGKGYHFKTSKGKVGYFRIDTGLFRFNELTGAEMTAILLHEIGHNFFITNTGRYLMPIFHLLTLLSNIINFAVSTDKLTSAGEFIEFILKELTYNTKPGRNVLSNIHKVSRENTDGFLFKFLAGLGTIKDAIISGIMTVAGLFLLPITVSASVTMGIIGTPISLALQHILSAYKNEKFADNFATMYGYGVHLSSALSKMSDYSKQNLMGKIYSSVPLVNLYYGCLSYYGEMFMSLMTPHPETPTRFTDQKKYLLEVLNTEELPVSVKKDIIKQIDDLDRIYRNMYRVTDLDSNFYKKSFYNMRQAAGGKIEDFRELFYRTKNYEWSEVYSERLK